MFSDSVILYFLIFEFIVYYLDYDIVTGQLIILA